MTTPAGAHLLKGPKNGSSKALHSTCMSECYGVLSDEVAQASCLVYNYVRYLSITVHGARQHASAAHSASSVQASGTKEHAAGNA